MSIDRERKQTRRWEMAIKKGDRVRINIPARDKYTPATSELATVKTVFKTGNIKVWSEWGHGFTLEPDFAEYGITIEVVKR